MKLIFLFRYLIFITNLLLIIFIILFSSCKQKHKNAPEKIVEKTESIDKQVIQILEEQLFQYKKDGLLILLEDTLKTSEWVYDLFFQNHMKPLWTSDEKLLPVADSLLSFIDQANYYGLSPNKYYYEQLKTRINLIFNYSKNKISATRLYEINILLTDVFFKLAVDLNRGQLNSENLKPIWKSREIKISVISLIKSALSENRIKQSLESCEPVSKEYQFLKKHLMIFLKEYHNNTIDLPLQVKSKMDLLSNYYSNSFFERSIVSENTNIIPDSIQLALNYLESQINIISINLERLKWDNKLNEDYYLNINIPSYDLKLFKCDTLELYSKVIVGKPETSSPFRLDSKITHFYIYPYWTVPFSIATKEILPILVRDTSYLSRHKMEVFDNSGNLMDIKKIKWKKYSEKYFPFKIRQRDGDENTLGVLKFIFSNKYGIYIHDTNSKSLFKKDKRALSHGCIRLEKAKELANEVISCCTINFSSDSLNYYLKKKERKKVDLFKPLPIHIRYFTCEADSDTIFFYNDVYRLDSIIFNDINLFNTVMKKNVF